MLLPPLQQKNARLAVLVFFAFSISVQGRTRGSICRFTTTLAAVAAWITAWPIIKHWIR